MGPGDLQLLVGLGNPGLKYSSTRHNIGFMVLEKFAMKNSITFKSQKNILGQLAELRDQQAQLKLLLPETYMNDSGRAIRACLDWFNIDRAQILVIVDDMDLPLGKLRVRSKGGAGGHKGLRSTIQHLKSEDFWRLRIGIGAPEGMPIERKSKTISHVLGNFSTNEQPLIEKVLNEVLLGIELIQSQGMNKASNYLNSFVPIESKD